MSIANDIRGYADTAIEQGKHVVGQAVGQAQAQFTEFSGRAAGAVNDLRVQAEKTLNIEALRTAVEPYLAQARQYRASVTDRAEGLLGSVKGDKRVAKVVATAESVSGVVVDTVTERVVKPVTTLTGRAGKPAATAGTAGKPAATRPAAQKAPAKKAATTTAKPTAAKRTTPAKKATTTGTATS
jgi:hypothetical protein